jgi:glycosyltransferase involved in cell wall biosynthesis
MGYVGNILALLPRLDDADIVMAHGDSLLLPLRGKPVIRLMHGSARDEARTATSIGRRVLQSGVYGLELLTALSGQHCVAVSANSQRSNPLVRHVTQNGVNLSVFKPQPSERSETPLVLFVGALQGRKRGGWLRQQFIDRVRPAHPAAELHMVGDVGESAPGVVYHTGLVEHALAALYRRAWIYASPSTYEGFGLPYVEALASGTPVVATANPGSLEVLEDGAYGCLPDDNAFADVVIELLHDADRRQELACAGLRRADAFSLERTLDQYESLMTTMVTARG